jgi:hypothetical protein
MRSENTPRHAELDADVIVIALQEMHDVVTLAIAQDPEGYGHDHVRLRSNLPGVRRGACSSRRPVCARVSRAVHGRKLSNARVSSTITWQPRLARWWIQYSVGCSLT